MIELKLSTVNAAILLATSRYFSDLAATVSHSPTYAVVDDAHPIEAAPLPLPLPLPLANVEDEEEAEEYAADLPTPPAVQFQTGAEVDKMGHAWDHRIHSATKSKIADGTWKLKRGVDPETVAACRAEFEQAAAIPPGPISAPLTPPAVAVDPIPSQPIPPAIAAPVVAPVETGAAKPTNPAVLFSTTLQMYAKAVQAGKIADGSGDTWAKQVGLPSLASLITRPDLCGQFYDQLSGLLA